MIKYLVFFFSMTILFAQCKEPCNNVDCGPNGTCIFGECDCDEGWSGERCDQSTVADPCEDIDCGPNGDCVDGQCECDEGFFGPLCDQVCDDSNCINGSCNPATGNCDCELGFRGENCEGKGVLKRLIIEDQGEFIFTYSTVDNTLLNIELYTSTGELDSRNTFTYLGGSRWSWGFSETGPDFIDDDPQFIELTDEGTLEFCSVSYFPDTGQEEKVKRVMEFGNCGWLRREYYRINEDPLIDDFLYQWQERDYSGANCSIEERFYFKGELTRMSTIEFDGMPSTFMILQNLEDDFVIGKIQNTINYKLEDFGNPVSQILSFYNDGVLTSTSEFEFSYEYDQWGYPISVVDQSSPATKVIYEYF